MTATHSRRVVNPWTWQDDLAFVQGVEVTGGRTLYLAGATSFDPDGVVVHAGDVRNQVLTALDNIGTILAEAGMRWEHLVRINWYVKGSALAEFWERGFPDLKERFDRVGCRAAGTMLGVECLAHPDLLCEFEATAVAPIES